MALRAVNDWKLWLTDLRLENDIISEYANLLIEAEITEDDLSELTHELLKEIRIIKPGHRTKILKKAKTENVSVSTKVIKTDIKLPHIELNSSLSQFRKFIIDWNIYKSESKVSGSKSNRLLYSACGELLHHKWTA